MASKKVLIISVVVILLIAIVLGCILFFPSELKCTDSAPNKCNNQCWEKCGDNRLFECDNSSGGMCVADPNNCPIATPNSCNGQCWACQPGETFACDVSLGGTCQKNI
jgi:hypothetical protein